MDQREEFLLRALEPGACMAELCAEHGVSRKTGYKWLRRFKEQGRAGLEDQRRRPSHTPLKTSAEVVLELVRLRGKHPRWGPKKLRALLTRTRPELTAPSVRTVARVLKRAGLVKTPGRRRQPRMVAAEAPAPEVEGPNDLWTVDFKGWWLTWDGHHCEPLTVRDAHSRYVLCLKVLPSTKGELVRQEFEQLFRAHGLPKAILSDNGSPFASTRALAGLSTLSVWWISLGITPLLSRPGCPQDNGAHERMHADIRFDLQDERAANVAEQQHACDLWRHEFNNVRPHEALEMRTPSDLYEPSRRRLAAATLTRYPRSWEVRRVTPGGVFSFRGRTVFVSRALSRQQVGIEPREDGPAPVWYCHLLIGQLDLDEGVRVEPIDAGARNPSDSPAADDKTA